MTMESMDLLPQLNNLPTPPETNDGRRRSFHDNMAVLISRDNILSAAEGATAANIGLWTIFDVINVDDTLTAAYEAHYTRLAADHSLHDQWAEMMERGPESMKGFVDGLKGKVAELDLQNQLTDAGWTNVYIPTDPTHPVWDIHATDPNGVEQLIQVKTGLDDYAYEVKNLMAENPDVNYAVSTEIYDKIAESAPDLLPQLMDIGPDMNLVEGIQDGLNTLTANLGIDVPDGIGELIPYAGAIIGSARLLHSVISTEKTFKAADRTTRNKIQVIQTLTLMSRVGINTVLATAGGMAGGAVGTAVPIIGNLIGGIAGTIAGAGTGMYLNKYLQPHMLELALDITSLTEDDLFYYKNKPGIDVLALNFRTTTQALTVG